jgi:tetratricopeptide (TPR) repeat protein
MPKLTLLDMSKYKVEIEQFISRGLSNFESQHADEVVVAVGILSEPWHGWVNLAVHTVKRGEKAIHPVDNCADWDYDVVSDYSNDEWTDAYSSDDGQIVIRDRFGNDRAHDTARDGDAKFGKPFFELFTDALMTVLRNRFARASKDGVPLLAGVQIGHGHLTLFWEQAGSAEGASNFRGDACRLPGSLGSFAGAELHGFEPFENLFEGFESSNSVLFDAFLRSLWKDIVQVRESTGAWPAIPETLESKIASAYGKPNGLVASLQATIVDWEQWFAPMASSTSGFGLRLSDVTKHLADSPFGFLHHMMEQVDRTPLTAAHHNTVDATQIWCATMSLHLIRGNASPDAFKQYVDIANERLFHLQPDVISFAILASEHLITHVPPCNYLFSELVNLARVVDEYKRQHEVYQILRLALQHSRHVSGRAEFDGFKQRWSAVVLNPSQPNYLDNLNNLANGYYTCGSPRDAEPLYAQILVELSRLSPSLGTPLFNTFFMSMSNYANCLADLNRANEGEPHALKSMRMRIDAFGLNSVDSVIGHATLGWVQFCANKFDAAYATYSKALSISANVPNMPPSILPYIEAPLGECARRLGKTAEARKYGQRAYDRRVLTVAPDDVEFGYSCLFMALLLADDGKNVDAENQFKQALRAFEKHNSHMTPRAMREFAHFLKRVGRGAEAQEYLDSAAQYRS